MPKDYMMTFCQIIINLFDQVHNYSNSKDMFKLNNINFFTVVNVTDAVTVRLKLKLSQLIDVVSLIFFRNKSSFWLIFLFLMAFKQKCIYYRWFYPLSKHLFNNWFKERLCTYKMHIFIRIEKLTKLFIYWY